MMKPYLVVLACLLTFQSAIAQKSGIKPVQSPIKQSNVINPNLFTGIGIFKIGTDTTSLINYANTQWHFIGTITSFDTLMEKQTSDEAESKLYRLKYLNDDESAGILESNCPNAYEFYLTQYEVAGVKMANIHLTYFKNKLVEFKCDASQDITDAITAKYSKPTLKVKTTKYTCTHNLTGIVTPLQAKSYDQAWSNGSITAHSLTWENYDSHCKLSTNDLFYYSLIDNEWQACETAGLNRQLHKTKMDKSKLKDF